MTRRTIQTRAAFAVACTLPLALAAGASAGECEPTWDPSPGQPGITGGIVFDATSLDTGDGAELYVSGSFTNIGGIFANRIARWDGSAWNPLGTGMSNAEVYAVHPFGGDLYAAGYFDAAGGVAGTAKIARWDGSTWNSLNAQLELFSNQLWDLTTWDDGTGEALYVCGNYQSAGGVSNASFISKWDGASWSSLGAPIGGAVPLIVFTAHVWDDGSGEALYAGGRFLTIDGVPANRIARWDGTSWSALGSGITGPGLSSSVNAMASYDDGGGDALYVAGQSFDTAGGVPASRVARWDGSSWSAVGDGFDNGIVWGLEVFDDGNGPALYATGTFTSSGGTPLRGLAKWNGSSWEDVGMTDQDTYRSFAFDQCTEWSLVVAGRYSTIGGETAGGVARLVSCAEFLVGDIDGNGVVNTVDLLGLLSAFGDCPAGEPCPADVDCDGTVDTEDLLALLANWT